MQFNVSRWLLVTGLIALASVVFRLLDRVFGNSSAWARTTVEYQARQAAREEFELRWARQLAPIARQSIAEAEVVLQRPTAESPVPHDVQSGVLHILVDDVQSIATRRLSVSVAAGASAYSASDVNPLVLPAGQYLVDLSGVTSDGQTVHSQLAAIVLPDEITHLRVPF